MSETQSDQWGGWKAQQRTSDPGALAAWRAQYTYGDKTAIMEQLALACGLGTELVQHWARHDRLNPAAVEFFDTCKFCHTHEITGHFLSGSVLEEWYAQDWRGKKGQPPTAPQLFERALMVKSRLERERTEELHRLPAAKRVSEIDRLPALYGADAVYSEEVI